PCGHKGSSISVNRIKCSIDPASHSILQDNPSTGLNKAPKPHNLAISAQLTQDILLFSPSSMRHLTSGNDELHLAYWRRRHLAAAKARHRAHSQYPQCQCGETREGGCLRGEEMSSPSIVCGVMISVLASEDQEVGQTHFVPGF
ncbi:hypothetical protein KUCAC02_004424, partial [Chaenocephalus aceratus]